MNRLKAAMIRLHQRGIQPTGQLAAEEAGTFFDPRMGLNGRDGKVFTTTMAELGYAKGANGRWERRKR